MANAPLTISIVTVCRNAEKTIRGTLESVLDQSYQGLEYLVVDGASTDNTLSIVNSFSRDVRVVSEPDNGIADAFNKGISLASHDVVGLVNADDRLVTGTLEFVCSYFRDHPDVDVIHGDVLLYDKKKFIKRIRPAGRWWYFWRLVMFNHPATFVRRAVYEKHGGFDSSFKIAMDVEIYLRWLKNDVSVRYVPEVFSEMQAGGASSDRATEGFREVRKALTMYGYPRLLSLVQYYCKVALHVMLTLVRSNH